MILFFWGFITQFLPWGVPVTQTVISQEGNTSLFMAPNAIEVPVRNLVTESFDTLMVNRVSTLATDRTFSWIVSIPIQDYDMNRYFIFEMITQIFISILIVAILTLTRNLPQKNKLLLLLIVSFISIVGIYFPFMNWWGLPPNYALGSGLNLLMGWTVTGYTIDWLINR